MEKSNSNRKLILLLIVFVVFPSLVSFIFCILAESYKTKADEVKFDGRSCSLPKSEAFRFGIGGLICLLTAQIFGNLIVGGLILCSVKTGFRRKKSMSVFSGIFLTVSWISCGVASTMILTAASMNKSQPYGKGWLNGECYVVKRGVFGGASILVLITSACIVVSSSLTSRPLVRVTKKGKPETQIQGS